MEYAVDRGEMIWAVPASRSKIIQRPRLLVQIQIIELHKQKMVVEAMFAQHLLPHRPKISEVRHGRLAYAIAPHLRWLGKARPCRPNHRIEGIRAKHLRAMTIINSSSPSDGRHLWTLSRRETFFTDLT